MWTPKRILILIAGVALFLVGFTVYGFFLGSIDGLPPLPTEFCDAGDAPVELPREQESAIDSKLRKAFGADCPEIKRMIKLDLARKGWGLASNQFEPEKDGRIKLTPFSAFTMTKRKGKDGWPEIHSVRADEAYLTLDRPVSNMTELGSRKIVQVELRSGGKSPTPIVVKNNRATESVLDDVEVRITEDSLTYNEEQSQIHSQNGFIALKDFKAGLKATEVTARGLVIRLQKEKDTLPLSPKSKQKHKGEGSSVKELVLDSNVHMWLHIDVQPGFFGSSEDVKKKGDTKKPVANTEKAHITITTDGPFKFNPNKDVAQFEGRRGEYIEVRRFTIDDGRADATLKCSQLELQFRKKNDKEASADDGTGNKEIETAHATAFGEELVTLDMTTDKLHAQGAEMIYHGATAEKGSTTIIKGNLAKGQPLHAGKEGHRIEAEELVLIGPNKNGEGQESFAKGPGQIDLFDKTKTDERLQYPWHAVWKDTLKSIKDKKDGKVYDLLTLTGEAVFIDDEHKQELHGKRLQLWLEPSGPEDAPKDPGDTKQALPGGARQKPAQLDAFENVSLHAPEMNIPNAHHMVIYFKDGVLADTQLPEALPGQRVDAEGASPQTVNLPSPPPGAAAASTGGPVGKAPAAGPARTGTPAQTVSIAHPPEAHASAGRGKAKGDPEGKKKPPINLEAREITAYVTRMGPQNVLRELLAQGTIHVHQDGSSPKDKGVDIKGDLLKLQHYLQGDILHVWGDAHAAAELQLGDLNLIGPNVLIDQYRNVAEVKGVGAMHMPARGGRDGQKPANPDARLVIHWNERMIFDGKHAAFYGGVEAFQETSSVRCQDLEVTLDRAVSFKEGQKGGQEAKVETMLCDKKVFVVEEKRDAAGTLLSYYRLEAPQADLDNVADRVHATGPGRVFLIEPAGKNDKLAVGPKSQQASSAKDKTHQLTRVEFSGAMFSTNKKDTRTSRFYDNVEVYHAPADGIDVQFNPDRPPKDAFYLRCDLLTTYTKALDQTKKAQYMQADGKVIFRTDKFFGNATTVKYNDTQDIVIFEGMSPNPPARLYQFQRQGQAPAETNGTKILYNRRTSEINVDGGSHIGDGP